MKILVLMDVIVWIESIIICGMDLYIFRGDVLVVMDGCIFGYEGVGVIIELGVVVMELLIGDCVIVFCISVCGKCDFCIGGLLLYCFVVEGVLGIGWIFGYLIDGI